MAISKWDEYLIHQTYDTIDEGGKIDAERIIVDCHNTDGTLHLMAGLGSYPQAKIMDGYVCVRHKGEQYNLRLSRHLKGGDRADTQIGPYSIKVIEPLKRWGLYVDENDYGMRCSLEFEGISDPHPLQLLGDSYPVFMHYVQMGKYTGSITLDDQRYDLEGFIGVRDRSWRPSLKQFLVGGRHAGGHFWFQAHFADYFISLAAANYMEGPDPFFTASILNKDGGIIPMTEIRHRAEFLPNVRAMSKVEFLMKDPEGKERHLIAKPISPALCFTGARYEQQGEDRGPLFIEGDKIDVSQPADIGSPLFGGMGWTQHIAEFQLDGEPGVGTLEVSYSPNREVEYKPTW